MGRVMNKNRILPAMAVLAGLSGLSACTDKSDGAGTQTAAYDGIADDEVISMIGTEPFWGIKIEGDYATYSTPENIAGTAFAVSRFAGNSGLGFNGKLDGEAVTITVTPGKCSDGMSDRNFPFTATVKLGESTLGGCGYTSAQPFTGDEAP
jgi:uncharacterized membrane protein